MHRRHFISASIALLAWPSLSSAQPARKPVRIGVLSSTSPEARSVYWDAFKDGMAKLGWIEGREVSYIYRYTHGDWNRMDALAAELVAEKPELIFAGTQPAALAVKRATREIPIVFAFVLEPVASGLVASLARPGGNATGLSAESVETRTKTLELLHEIRPQLRQIAVTVGRGDLGRQILSDVERAARSRGIDVHALVIGTPDELEKALEALAGIRVDGVLFLAAAMLSRRRIAERMAKLRLPTVYGLSETVVSGGLASYGVDIAGNYRRAARYADRILRGAKAEELPVEQPTTFELVVNLKAAREQGIKLPQSVLIRATRVIE